jgi:hypothetical protein
MKQTVWYSCLHGHSICAVEDHTDVVVDLTGHFCPVCMGKIVSGLQGRDDGRILSVKQV